MQNYINALNLCVAKDTLYTRLKEPFREEQYVFSTDARILLGIHESCFTPGQLAKYKHREDKVKAMNVITNALTLCSKQITVSYIQNMLDQCPPAARRLSSCRECQGSGQVIYKYTTKIDDEHFFKEFELKAPCPICKGTGEEPSETPGYRETTAIRLMHGMPLIAIKYILRLLQVLKTLGIDTISIAKYGDYQVHFAIPGKIQIVVMGIFEDEDTKERWTIITPSQCVASLE